MVQVHPGPRGGVCCSPRGGFALPGVLTRGAEPPAPPRSPVARRGHVQGWLTVVMGLYPSPTSRENLPRSANPGTRANPLGSGLSRSLRTPAPANRWAPANRRAPRTAALPALLGSSRPRSWALGSPRSWALALPRSGLLALPRSWAPRAPAIGVSLLPALPTWPARVRLPRRSWWPRSAQRRRPLDIGRTAA